MAMKKIQPNIDHPSTIHKISDIMATTQAIAALLSHGKALPQTEYALHEAMNQFLTIATQAGVIAIIAPAIKTTTDVVSVTALARTWCPVIAAMATTNVTTTIHIPGFQDTDQIKAVAVIIPSRITAHTQPIPIFTISIVAS
jgi:hypothetical protein